MLREINLKRMILIMIIITFRIKDSEDAAISDLHCETYMRQLLIKK